VLQLATKSPVAATQGVIDGWRTFLETDPNYQLVAMDDFDPAWRQRDANYSLAKAPVRLLAVVNRVDLGLVGNGEVCGAEVRFVYAALPVLTAKRAPEGRRPFLSRIFRTTSA
jgi:hypothetical protein